MPLASNDLYRQIHEVHGAQNVVKTCVQSPGIHQMRHAKLLDAPKTLHVRVFYEVKNELVGYGNESVNRIVENLLFVVFTHSYRIVVRALKIKKITRRSFISKMAGSDLVDGTAFTRPNQVGGK